MIPEVDTPEEKEMQAKRRIGECRVNVVWFVPSYEGAKSIAKYAEVFSRMLEKMLRVHGYVSTYVWSVAARNYVIMNKEGVPHHDGDES